VAPRHPAGAPVSAYQPPALPGAALPQHSAVPRGQRLRLPLLRRPTRHPGPLPQPLLLCPLPQFNIGHLETVSGAQQELRKSGWDGVLLGGNYVAGAGGRS
jgi:hypothetical protein